MFIDPPKNIYLAQAKRMAAMTITSQKSLTFMAMPEAHIFLLSENKPKIKVAINFMPHCRYKGPDWFLPRLQSPLALLSDHRADGVCAAVKHQC